MQAIFEAPPAPPPTGDNFEIREGFMLISTLDEFRAAIKRDDQRIRMRPGVYRAAEVDPPISFPVRHAEPDEEGDAASPG